MVPTESKLLGLLSNNDVTFFIPPYQRNYTWDKEHCDVFFEDVVKTAQRNLNGEETEHFFGSVTYFQDDAIFGQPDKLVLIDGQQRITTAMLFLIAVRDLAESDDIKKIINDKYLKNQNVIGDTEYKIKLKQVETDWNAYRAIVLEEDLDEREKNSVVYQNYLLFKRRLSENTSGCTMLELIDKGLNKFSIITIELKPKQNKWENPQEIFESMNSLGKPLTLADLVRNYLLLGMSADQQEKLYQKYWLQIEKRLSNISDFIRDYMQLKAKKAYSKATDRNYKTLYADFKILFMESDTTDLIEELNTYSKYYAYIVMGDASGNTAIDIKLKDIRQIGVTTSYSFLMGLTCSWKEERLNDHEIESILDVLLIYFIRRRIIGLAAAENKSIPELARKIPDIEKAAEKTTRLLKILADQESNLRIPNDIELERELSLMNFFNFKYAKFILALVEEHITKSRPALDDQKLQLEHIMPQTLSDEWIEVLGPDHEAIHQELVHNIGNLTLIRHNQELGNKPFSEKTAIYENHAGLQIAKTEIINHNVWNADAIRNRAKWIISYILTDVLPIPDEMRRINNFSSKKHRSLSFIELQLIGEEICFIKDRTIRVKVVSDTEVAFEGKTWKLSPLTRELETRRGTVTNSGSYQGAQYWEYDGIRLFDIM